MTSENHRVEEVVPAWLLVIRYFCALAFVVLVGVAAWWVADNEGESDFVSPNQEKKWWFIQLLGWSSALLYVRASHILSIPSDHRFSSVPAFHKYVRSLIPFFLRLRLIRTRSEKLPNTVRRVVPCIIFLCNIREYDLCVIDMCEEYGYELSDYKWWLVSR